MKQRRRLNRLAIGSAVMVMWLGLAAVPAVATTPGWVDTTYGTGGASVVPNAAFGVTIVDSMGRALVLGLTNGSGSGGQVTRLTPTGQLDSTFGTGGTVTLPSSSVFYTALTLDSNGLVYALGTNAAFNSASTSFDVTRLTAAGAVDSSFGTGGTATIGVPMGTPTFKSDSITVRPDGEVLVSLHTTDSTTQGELVALTSAGALDTSVNASGTNPGILPLPASEYVFDLTASLPPTTPVFTADTPPANAYQNSPYSYTFAATGIPPATFSVASGSLPAGLTLSPSGVLSGTPTATGPSTFTVTASNGVGTAPVTASITITVNPPMASPMFTADTPPATAVVGTAYAGYVFAASGEPAPTFTVSSGALPGGLSLDSHSGALSGTPTTGGVFTFKVTAANGQTPDAVSPSITITVDFAPTFTAASPKPGNLGAPYSYTFTASGLPQPTFSVASGTLPPGLSLSTGGILSGVPTAQGSFTFAVQAANGITPNAVTGSLLVKITAKPVAPMFTADMPPSPATVGVEYSYQFMATGHPVPRYSISGVAPTGLKLVRATGVLSGMPTKAGTYSFTIEASNGVNPPATHRVTITVKAATAAATPAGSAAPSAGATPATATQAAGPDQNTTVAILVNDTTPTPSYGLQRYLTPLTLDGSFGTGGTLIFPAGDVPHAVAEADDGSYYVTGGSGQSVFLAHVLAAGQFDAGFGSKGLVLGPPETCTPAGGALSIAAASIDVLAVNSTANSTCQPSPGILLRFTNGALDTTFGSGGEVRVDSVGALHGSGPNGVGAQPDGEVLVGLNGTTGPQLAATFGAAVVQIGSSGAGPALESFTQGADDSHFAAGTVAANPSAAYVGDLGATVDGSGTVDVFARKKNNDLVEFHQTASGWSTAVDLTANTSGAPGISSTPEVTFDGTKIDVFALTTAGDLVEYRGTGSTYTATDVNAAAGSGSPMVAALIDPVVIGGAARAYAMTTGGDLVEVDNDNSGGHAWNFYDLTVDAGGGAVIAGGPAALLIDTTPHVYTRVASNNHLLEYVADGLNGRVWNAYDVTAAAPTGPAISGNPEPALIGTTPHVYVTSAVNGDLVEYVADHLNGNVWNAYDQTATEGAPKPVGNPAVILTDGTPYGLAQPVPEVWETPSSGELTTLVADHVGANIWNAYDVTSLSGGPQVSGDPTPVLVPGGNGTTMVEVFIQGLAASSASGSSANGSPGSSLPALSGSSPSPVPFLPVG